MSDKTSLGDRMKFYENMTEATAMPRLPLLARVDGRAFHTFTRGLTRPYDVVLSRLMQETTQYLVDEFDAKIGYTQSDEISLLWYQENERAQLPFGGRILKLTSVLASAAAAYFNCRCHAPIYVKLASRPMPMFDCRVWSVPTQDEAVNYFLWRERDATKNSVSMAAQCMFSHAELQNKNGTEQMELLFQAGTNWNHYPSFFKRGSYLQRVVVERALTPSEIDALPAKHAARTNPRLLVKRSTVSRIDMPPLGSVWNKKGVLFFGEEPKAAPKNDFDTLEELAS